jgi:hypothetical protein
LAIKTRKHKQTYPLAKTKHFSEIEF